MPNPDVTNAFAAALSLTSAANSNIVTPYGLDGSTGGETQGATQAIAPPLHSDINADGYGDIIWRNYSTGANAVWKTPTESNINADFIEGLGDTDWLIAAAGDFNNDGYSDLLWRNRENGQNVLWYMNNGVVQERSFITGLANTSWEIKAAGDFDQDGNLDILWRKNDTGASAVWLMNSDASIKERAFVEGLSDLSWEIVGAADFDGDSSTDILWRNQQSGQNVIWWDVRPNQSNTPRSFIEGLNSPNWQIQGAGDLNGDGSVSILWRNYETGGNALWQMNSSQDNDSTLTERLFLPSIANPSWQAVIAAQSATQSNATAQDEQIPEEPPAPTPAPTAPPEPQDDISNGFDITFDYRFDTDGWFTAERRAALEASAEVWESIILDDFETTTVGTATPFVTNPETGSFTGINDIFITDVEIDDLLIFVGARSLGSGTLGQGGASGYYLNEERYVGSDFEPWLGSISFNRDADWFFDATPSTSNDIPNNQSDFISTAVHEIGHVLGFNAAIEAFSEHLNSAGDFAGPNAIARNGGTAIPLEGSHIEDGHEFGGSGEVVLDPISFPGVRQLPTILDIAIFDDIGYEVDYSQATQNQSENRDSGISGDTGSNRMVAHDSSAPDCCSCASCQNGSLQLALTGEISLEEMIAG